MSVMMIQSGRFASAEFSPLDLSPALWIDPSDAATVTISGSSGAYIGPNGLVLPSSGVNNATSPDSGPLSVTGSIDVIVKATKTSWTGAICVLVSKYISSGGTDNSFVFYLNSTGTLAFDTLDSANTAFSSTSTAAVGFSAGATKWVRVTFNASTAEVMFYTGDDGTSWTQLGSTLTSKGTSLKDSTRALTIGAYAGGDSMFSSGTIHRSIIKNGIDGTTVFDADFENATPYVSAFTESALGAPVYVVSSTATSATANYSYIGPEGLVCSGSGENRASTSDSAALDITGDIDIIVKAKLVDWTPAALQILLMKSAATTATNGAYWLSLASSGVLSLDWYTSGGSARSVSSTVATGVTDGTAKWVRATLDVDNGASGHDVQFWTSDDGASWTQLGATVTTAGVTSIRSTIAELRIGQWESTAFNAMGTIMRGIVKNGIDGTTVFDANFEAAADYAASFTESSSNAATVTITATNTPANAAGALVSQINDKSGNARHLTQGTAANMPKYWNGRNGLNCLVFDGTNDQMASSLDASTLPASLLTVVSLASLGSARTIFGSNNLVDGLQFRSASTNRPELLKQGVASLGAGTNALSAGVPSVVDATTTAAAQAHYLNGVANGTSANAVSLATCTTLVGANQAATQFWQGLICELVKVDAVVSAPNLASWYTYAKAKWGTP